MNHAAAPFKIFPAFGLLIVCLAFSGCRFETEVIELPFKVPPPIVKGVTLKDGVFSADIDENSDPSPTPNPAPAQIVLEVSAITGGTASPSGTVTGDANGEKVFTATPDAGYAFAGWFLPDNTFVTANPYTHTLTESGSIVASFTALPAQITVNVSAITGGTVDPAGATTGEINTTVVFTATPDVGYTFAGWLLPDNTFVAANPYTHTLTENGNLVASFNVVHPDLFSGAGSFEGTTTAPFDLFVGDTIQGWTVGGTVGMRSAVLEYNPGGSPTGGDYYMAFNSGNQISGGEIARSVATEVGTNYVLTLRAGRVGGTDQPLSLTVSIVLDGGTTQDFVITPASVGWDPEQSITFTATSVITEIRIKDTSTAADNEDITLGDVQLTQAP